MVGEDMNTRTALSVIRIADAYMTRMAVLPPGFGGFKDTRPYKADPDTEVRHKLESLNHGMPEMRPAHTFLSSVGVRHLVEPSLLYWNRRAWSVQVDAPNKAAAERLGRTIQKNLLPKKSLTSADPYLYELPLFVRFDGGFVEVPGIAPTARKTPGLGDGTADQKHRVKLTGEAFFGAGSISIAGTDGAYTLRVIPKLKVHQGLFKHTEVGGATIAELSEKLNGAISKVEAFLARK